MTDCPGVAEFDRQLRQMLAFGYPQRARMPVRRFTAMVAPLRRLAAQVPIAPGTARGRIPFVIVVKTGVVAAAAVMPLVTVKGKTGLVDMRPVVPEEFALIAGMPVPDAPAYLLLNVATGRKTLNVTVARALPRLRRQRRLPLTIDEGVALAVQFPEVLQDKQRYNCFWMAGSRRGDRRVPAMWISFGRPRLGWCWENTPHTWLGTASCAGRVAAHCGG
ncbi:MAG TPA: DUF5701 family protein [bacterium]|nr:DUF5701 family protein [bacterium]